MQISERVHWDYCLGTPLTLSLVARTKLPMQTLHDKMNQTDKVNLTSTLKACGADLYQLWLKVRVQ